MIHFTIFTSHQTHIHWIMIYTILNLLCFCLRRLDWSAWSNPKFIYVSLFFSSPQMWYNKKLAHPSVTSRLLKTKPTDLKWTCNRKRKVLLRLVGRITPISPTPVSPTPVLPMICPILPSPISPTPVSPTLNFFTGPVSPTHHCWLRNKIEIVLN